MTPQETQFVNVLVEGGVISFSDAGLLEQAQDRLKDETGVHRPVWDIAVEEGIVTSAQAKRFLEKIKGALDAVVQAADAGATATQELDTRNLAPAASQVARSAGAPGGGEGGGRGGRGGYKLGNYRLISKLGQGGMGAVYKAKQESMDRIVAIKVLPRNLAQNQDFIGRFLREAKAAGRLRHPNVVLGIDTSFAEGYYYFAMEYVEGQGLDRRLKKGPFEEDEVVRIALQMTGALAHAHAEGIVHRDVKPENILLAPGGQAKLCDLGLARSTGDDMRITQAGQAVGTPYYISPEQVRGDDPGPQADIYSLGATLYHLVTGAVPFDGDNPMAVMQKHLNDVPRRPTDVRPAGVSKALEAVIMKMMARSLHSRYATMEDVEADLRKVGSGEVPSALRGAMAHRRAGGRRGTRGTRATRPITRRRATGGDLEPVEDARRFPVKTVIAVAAVLALIGAFGAFLALREGEPGGGGGGSISTEKQLEAERLERLATELEGIRAFEKQSPADYAGLVKRYSRFMESSTGTEYEAQARQALSAIRKRQEADRSEERLAKLEAGFGEITAFEKANPEKYAEVIARYTTFAGGAAGTDFESRAKAALEATAGRRRDRAAELLAATRRSVAAEQRAGRFGAALAKVTGFRKVYAGVVAEELAALEKSVRAAGRARWDSLLSEAREQLGKKRFSAAKKKAEAGRNLGLDEAEAWVSQALVEIEKARVAHEEEVAAGYRARYRKFSGKFEKLLKAGRFAEALAGGRPLAGKLGPELDGRLAADLALASGARDFISGLRQRLKKAPEKSFSVRLALGRARLLRFHPETDRLDFSLDMGSTSLRIADFKGARLVELAGRAGGGKLTAAECRLAACYLLALGEAGGVAALIEKAGEGGQDVAGIRTRLALISKGAHEVEAEGLLARFDKQVAAKSWQAAVTTGQRLLKEYSETAAVRKRGDLRSLIDRAKHSGDPLRIYNLVLQNGAIVGGGIYSGTRDACLDGNQAKRNANPGRLKVLESRGETRRMLVRFNVFAAEGGPVPDGAEVLGARLCVFKLSRYQSGLAAHEILKDWDESGVTYAKTGKGETWSEAGCRAPGKDYAAGAVAGCELGYSPNVWASMDVTASLKAWSAKKRVNRGWLLEDVSEDTVNLRGYCSREYTKDITKRPRLVLKVRCRRLAVGTAAGAAGALQLIPAGLPRRHWTGAAGGNWSDARNWAEGRIPGKGEAAVFDGKSRGDCTVDSPASLAALCATSDYRGRLQLAAPLVVAGPMVLAGPVFDAGNQQLSIRGAQGRGRLVVAGSEVRLGSATHLIQGSWIFMNGKLDAGTSTVKFDASTRVPLQVSGEFSLHKARFESSGRGSSDRACILKGKLTVEDSLVIKGRDKGGWRFYLKGGGCIRAKGDVTSNRVYVFGTAGIALCGRKGDQTVTDLWWHAGPYTIDKPDGRACWKGSTRFCRTSLEVKSPLEAGEAQVWLGTSRMMGARDSRRELDVRGSFTVGSLVVCRERATGHSILDFHGGTITVARRLVLKSSSAGGWHGRLCNATFVCKGKLEITGDPWRGRKASVRHGGQVVPLGGR